MSDSHDDRFEDYHPLYTDDYFCKDEDLYVDDEKRLHEEAGYSLCDTNLPGHDKVDSIAVGGLKHQE